MRIFLGSSWRDKKSMMGNSTQEDFSFLALKMKRTNDKRCRQPVRAESGPDQQKAKN